MCVPPGLNCREVGEDNDGKKGYFKKHSRRLWEGLKVSVAIDLVLRLVGVSERGNASASGRA